MNCNPKSGFHSTITSCKISGSPSSRPEKHGHIPVDKLYIWARVKNVFRKLLTDGRSHLSACRISDESSMSEASI